MIFASNSLINSWSSFRLFVAWNKFTPSSFSFDGCSLLSTSSRLKCDRCILCNCSLYLDWVQWMRFFSDFCHWWQATGSCTRDCIRWNDPSWSYASVPWLHSLKTIIYVVYLFPLLFPNIVTILVSLLRNQCKVLGRLAGAQSVWTWNIDTRRHCWSRCI